MKSLFVKTDYSIFLIFKVSKLLVFFVLIFNIIKITQLQFD